ncbi:pectinesterase 1 [Aristolochia californica]|uniref:pectinesterase 1 n=1 Tax=Aristolochia californica TaxID=171875 RepID=UPI0035DF661A
MDSINSFKGYDKVNKEDLAFRRKSCKRYAIIGASVVVLLVIIIGAVVGTRLNSGGRSNSDQSPTSTSPSTSIKAVCGVTQYQDVCVSSLSSVESSDKGDPEQLFKLSMKVAVDELTRISSIPQTLKTKANAKMVRDALGDCEILIEDAIDQLNSSMALFSPGSEDGKILSKRKINDLRTWLSAALTDHETCLDGLGDVSAEMRNIMSSYIKNSTQFTSNSLAIATKIISILEELDISLHRKLLSTTWLSGKYRRLLQAEQPEANVTVAQDGSGNFTTIKAAVEAVPRKSKSRFVIHIKAGTYKENVIVDKTKWNVVMMGDGQETTIISGSLNKVDGTPTFDSGTVIAAGKGFMARDISFVNNAGPAKHQAVAFRSSSDQSVFYRCTFDAFQDTLYVHSHRQFYRDCTIRGTVDFIFGNAAVVFQSCLIQPKEPGESQKNTITAQGKVDANQNTGISIQGCTLSPYEKVTAPTYLGRPWKDYSTTLIMQSTIDSVVDHSGWLSWMENTLPPDTINYAEYSNQGPGSGVESRVKWAGYKPAISKEEARKFTVDPFIQGSDWLPNYGVVYGATL